MAIQIWEWNPSNTQEFKWNIAQSAQRDNGTWPPDIPYPGGPGPIMGTLTAENMTSAESETERLKQGTSASFTVHDGVNATKTITGLVAGWSEGPVKKSGTRTVTLTLIRHNTEA